ncbi:MAG: hypothetical protein AB7S38_22995 [Vulcanimicrobiota bacterium]
MRRLLHRVYYVIESLFLAHPGYQLVLVAVAMLLVSLMGGMVVHFVSGDFDSVGQAVWWAFLHLTDSGYLGNDQGFVRRVVSCVLTVLGMVLFVGAAVAIMTNGLDRLLNFLASGRSPVFEKGHILILGWNHRVYALVEEVFHSGRALYGEDWHPSIVILCPEFHPDLQRELLQKLDPKVRKQSNVLVRSGNPLEAESLERVDFTRARSIILVAGKAHQDLSDVTLAKTLMSIKAQAGELRQNPNVVVEVANPANKLLTESVGWSGSTEALASGDFLGLMFVQAVRQPGISRLYNRFLTDNFGDAVLLISAESLGLTGKTLRQASLDGKVAIGYLKAGGGQEALRLTALDDELAADDEVVVISPGDDPGYPALSTSTARGSELKVLVLGWSNHLTHFVRELGRYTSEKYTILLACESCPSLGWRRLSGLAEGLENVELSRVDTSLGEAESLAKLRPGDYDSVVLFADPRAADPLVADAETVVRTVLVHRLLGREVGLVVELNDEDNRALVAYRAADIFLTQEVVSHLLAQVALRRSLAWIYEELFTVGGAEIHLAPGPSGTFRQAASEFLDRGAVAIGYEQAGRFALVPNPETTLPEGARVVLIEPEG